MQIDPEEEEEEEELLSDSSAWESVFDGEGGEVMAQPRKAQQFPDWLSAQQVGAHPFPLCGVCLDSCRRLRLLTLP